MDGYQDEPITVTIPESAPGNEPPHTQAVTPTSLQDVDNPLPYASEAMPIPWSTEWKLYLSHFLSTWNSRSFEFGAVLFLAEIFPNTLLQLSIYAMVRAASAIVLSSKLGRCIDFLNRMSVVRTSIVLGRLSVVLSCTAFFVLFSLRTNIPNGARVFVFVFSVIMACIEKAASILNLVSVERDWVVVVADGKLNARMRRIDLFCKLVGPLSIALIDQASTEAAIWLTLGVNALCLPVEWFAIARVYGSVWKLREPKHPELAQPVGFLSVFHIGIPCTDNFIGALRIYFQDPAFLPSFSLALLYLTVLSFGGQMVTYLIAAGFQSWVIAITRSLSTVFELTATWIAPRVMLRISPLRGGMWFLSWQMLCLLGTLLSFWTAPSMLSGAIFLAAGTILSRVGLWGFDLCAQTIIQTDVLETHRGVFSTTETMFQNAFELISYSLTIGFSDPKQFRWPVLISVFMGWTASCLYAWYLRKRRGHLLHFPCIEKQGAVAIE